jgi:DNA polymerase III epsilon subunit-like protein
MSGGKGFNLSPAAFPCAQCTRSFASANAVAQHGRFKHAIPGTANATASSPSNPDGKALIPCTIPSCARRLSSQQALEQHLHSAAHSSKQKASTQDVGKNKSTLSSQDDPPMAHEKAMDVVGKTSYPNIEFLAPVVMSDIANADRNQSSEPAEASNTSLKPPIQHHMPMFGSPKRPDPSRLSPSPQTKEANDALSLNNDQLYPRENSLQNTHAMHSIKDCYIIATPRKGGGQPLVSPLVLDLHSMDFDLALLVSSPEPLQQPGPSASSLGICNSCGFRFITWESFTTHFYHSFCVTTVPRSDAEESFIASQLIRKAVSGGDVTTAESLPQSRKGKEAQKTKESKNVKALKKGEESKRGRESMNVKESQKGKESKTQPLNTQVVHKWTIIPQDQQLPALIALMSCCHSSTILTANGYPSDTGHVDPVGEGAKSILLGGPAYDPKNAKLSAVALDCEMVGVGEKSISEIARISAIDYLTGEILIDSLVQPTQPVKDWRTKYSGITEDAMTEAIAQRKILSGWPEARASLFRHIDANTVLIGQSLQYDLLALGIQHERIVDSAILASAAVGRNAKRQWGLKDLCTQLLGIKIQNDDKAGHDSVEDAFAAREVVLWCMRHPDRLKQWGKKQRKEYYGKTMHKSKAKQGLSSSRTHLPYRGIGYEEDDEILRWSDIAEDCGYPHPDTGYDPWSD